MLGSLIKVSSPIAFSRKRRMRIARDGNKQIQSLYAVFRRLRFGSPLLLGERFDGELGLKFGAARDRSGGMQGSAMADNFRAASLPSRKIQRRRSLANSSSPGQASTCQH